MAHVPFAEADGFGLDFYSQCPLLLQQVPSVTNECLMHARPWEEIFDDRPGRHSAYIVTLKSGSQFAIGCTLDSTGLIQYLGVYYTMNSDNFKYANSASLAFVDFEGDFALLSRSGLANFVALREFEIDPKIADPYYRDTSIKNYDRPEDFSKGAVPDRDGFRYYIK